MYLKMREGQNPHLEMEWEGRRWKKKRGEGTWGNTLTVKQILKPAAQIKGIRISDSAKVALAPSVNKKAY